MLGRLERVATGTATPAPPCLIRSPSLTVTPAPPLFAALIFRAFLFFPLNTSAIFAAAPPLPAACSSGRTCSFPSTQAPSSLLLPPGLLLAHQGVPVLVSLAVPPHSCCCLSLPHLHLLISLPAASPLGRTCSCPCLTLFPSL